ncbi:MAG TPA: efflux RND transporter periplasmic adaptor subunit [Candidatus Polarisedimenticolia bacterium]|nr:efflux RND transporter periplasmic adaptor subunit [Candidatus Polarisedimenticolia bacterium]
MAKRMIIVSMVLLTFIGSIGFVKFRQVQAAIAQASSFQPPPEAVTTTVARQDSWRRQLSAIGTVAAVQGVTVSADLPGIVEKILFESGGRVREGDVLVLLDTKQEQAQLASAEARRELARLSLERIRGLREKGVSSQSEFDTATAESAQAEASVREIRATINRKTIRAPFSGVLGIRTVNVGEYLKSGQPVVPLQALDPIYVNFNVPQQDLRRLSAGSEVRVSADGERDTEIAGRITAIDSVVDESTRNVKIQAVFSNPQLKLRPGMFVNSEVTLGEGDTVIPIPASAIRYAPFGDSVFIVEAVKDPQGRSYRGVRQQFVKLGSARGDQVAILSGIQAGEEIVTSGAFKLRNGSSVQVNNAVQPGNDPAPKPEDN